MIQIYCRWILCPGCQEWGKYPHVAVPSWSVWTALGHSYKVFLTQPGPLHMCLLQRNIEIHRTNQATKPGILLLLKFDYVMKKKCESNILRVSYQRVSSPVLNVWMVSHNPTTTCCNSSVSTPWLWSQMSDFTPNHARCASWKFIHVVFRTANFEYFLKREFQN